MATTTLVINAERWLDETILFASLTGNMGAAVSESFRLPPGFGDCAIMNVVFRASSVDVLKAAAAIGAGVRAFILNEPATKIVDNVGVAPWFLTQDGANILELGCFIDPDALVLWRQDELLSMTSPELDSDATPTGNMDIAIKVVRVKPIEASIQPQPIRLVR